MASFGAVACVAITMSLGLGCARSLFECPATRAVQRQTELRTFRHSNGVVSATGRGLASSWDDEYESWDSSYKREVPATRLGTWQYFYPDGSKRAEVTYALSCYIQCCSGGLCPQIHDYPVGQFALWYPSGKKLGEGSFATIWYHVETSCEGGDDTKVGRLSPDSRFWREDGHPMTTEEARASGYLFPSW